jgi:hypothetical protein
VYGATAGITVDVGGSATLMLINGEAALYGDATNILYFVGVTDMSLITLI